MQPIGWWLQEVANPWDLKCCGEREKVLFIYGRGRASFPGIGVPFYVSAVPCTVVCSVRKDNPPLSYTYCTVCSKCMLQARACGVCICAPRALLGTGLVGCGCRGESAIGCYFQAPWHRSESSFAAFCVSCTTQCGKRQRIE